MDETNRTFVVTQPINNRTILSFILFFIIVILAINIYFLVLVASIHSNFSRYY